jgi:carbonic anhydrase|nr:carbonic anhydrase family protein [uncultured Emticicia sp.]
MTIKILLSSFLIFAFISCNKDSEEIEPNSEVHWDYESQATWSTLALPDNQCAGLIQTPINIESSNTIKSMLPELGLNYSSFPINIIDNGHTIQINNKGTSSLKYNKQEYALSQFHFHSHSEHTIDGKSARMEIHFVHKSSTDGSLLVIGVLVEEGGAANASIASYIDSFPTVIEKESSLLKTINPLDLFPASKKYYNYTGSLTTPPCSQGLNWIVLKDKLKISAEQISKFEAKYNHNFRPVLPVGSRTIFESI